MKLQATSCSTTFNLALPIGIKGERVAEVAVPLPLAQRKTRLQRLSFRPQHAHSTSLLARRITRLQNLKFRRPGIVGLPLGLQPSPLVQHITCTMNFRLRFPSGPHSAFVKSYVCRSTCPPFCSPRDLGTRHNRSASFLTSSDCCYSLEIYATSATSGFYFYLLQL